MRRAAEGGHQRLAAWLAARAPPGPPLSAALFEAAAGLGCLPLLRDLRARGCEWGEGVWEGAAAGGCAAALEWLHEAGCPKPVGRCCCFCGAHLLEAHEQHTQRHTIPSPDHHHYRHASPSSPPPPPPTQADGEGAFAAALAAGDVSTLTALRRLGLTWRPRPSALTDCLVPGCAAAAPPPLAWLLSQGCEPHWRTALQRAEPLRRTHPALLAWLHCAACV
jgi:hypothetical protein